MCVWSIPKPSHPSSSCCTWPSVAFIPTTCGLPPAWERCSIFWAKEGRRINQSLELHTSKSFGVFYRQTLWNKEDPLISKDISSIRKNYPLPPVGWYVGKGVPFSEPLEKEEGGSTTLESIPMCVQNFFELFYRALETKCCLLKDYPRLFSYPSFLGYVWTKAPVKNHVFQLTHVFATVGNNAAPGSQRKARKKALKVHILVIPSNGKRNQWSFVMPSNQLIGFHF